MTVFRSVVMLLVVDARAVTRFAFLARIPFSFPCSGFFPLLLHRFEFHWYVYCEMEIVPWDYRDRKGSGGERGVDDFPRDVTNNCGYFYTTFRI